MENEPLFNDVEELEEVSNTVVIEDLPPPPPLEDKEDKVDITENLVELVEDKEAKRKELIEKITQFQATFPRIVLNLPKKGLDKCELSKLEYALQEGESKLKQDTGAQMMIGMFYHFTYLVEVGMTQQAGIDMNGYTDRLKKQEEEINKYLAQISYKYYEQLKYFHNPELQLGLILLLNGMTTFNRNRMLNKMLTMCKTDEEKEDLKKKFQI